MEGACSAIIISTALHMYTYVHNKNMYTQTYNKKNIELHSCPT